MDLSDEQKKILIIILSIKLKFSQVHSFCDNDCFNFLTVSIIIPHIPSCFRVLMVVNYLIQETFKLDFYAIHSYISA